LIRLPTGFGRCRVPHRFIVSVVLLTAILVSGCSGGNTTSSGAATESAGVYTGSSSINGVSRPLRIVISEDGIVSMQPTGGFVCPGDVPDGIGLDGSVFSSTTTERCIVNGFPCPANTSISGSVDDSTITGSGQVLLGCPGGPVLPVGFTFIALRQ